MSDCVCAERVVTASDSGAVCITWGLEVQRYHLTAGIPEYLRHIITRVHSASFGVDPTHLALVVTVHLSQGKTLRLCKI